MPWFTIDDSFPEHPKLERLEDDPLRWMAATSVWTIVGADCMRRLTDGFVSHARLKKLLGFLGEYLPVACDALVEIGLWSRAEGGYQYHDWLDWQRSREQVMRERNAKNDRQKRYRDGLRDTPRDTPRDASTNASTAIPRSASRDASTGASLLASRDGCPLQSPPIQSPPRSPPTPPRGERERAKPPSEIFSVTDPAEGVRFANAVAVKFSQLFQAHFRDVPALGGKNVGEFPARLLGTAQIRGVKPLELLEQAFSAWCQKPLDPIAKRAPYASFITAFGELIHEQNETVSAADARLEHQERQLEALRSGDHTVYKRLVDEYKALYPETGGGNAKSA